MYENRWQEFDILETNINVNVISDVLYNGNRVTTMIWKVPRFLLPQLNTYRIWSRNVSSSRAKKFSQTSAEVLENPYVPYIWQADHKGMQTTEQIESWKVPFVNFLWRLSARTQTFLAWAISAFGVSKQYTNRMIEPYMYVDYLVTSTDYENFLFQRDSYHAQLEIQVLARRVKLALNFSIPKIAKEGEWILPFVSEREREKYSLTHCVKFSVARCARTSYLTKLGGFDPDSDYKLAERLARDYHLSPFEHQILTIEGNGGNLNGVTQLRKLVEEEIKTTGFFKFENLDLEKEEE